MNADPLEQAKRLMRTQLAADLGEALSKLRKAKPELSLTEAWARLEVEEPTLVAAARAADEDVWPEPKPEPLYRYRPGADSSDVDQRIRDSLKFPSLVKARKDDTQGAVLVEARHAERLERETQKLMDLTPGLHRDIARHAVLDTHPDLAGPAEERDQLAAAQSEIKRRIKDMQTADQEKTFRACWEKLQREEPSLFEPIPAA
jgi:hypothetical protein